MRQLTPELMVAGGPEIAQDNETYGTFTKSDWRSSPIFLLCQRVPVDRQGRHLV
jgi:hypothetical protein